ncbi:MAG TPA: hypothetical protein PK518_02275, partial [Alicycliphilus sp.]|nr:hypothetical protein [Alicycliphilus sp.]
MFFSEGFFKNVDDGYVWLAGLAFKGASVLRVAFCVLRFAFCVNTAQRSTLNLTWAPPPSPAPGA